MTARSSVQGYVRQLNLAETTDDRQALNNIGEAPIADDIALFANNTRNESVLPVRQDEYDVNSGIVKIDNQTETENKTRSTVFTNGDEVRLVYASGNEIAINLYIRDSNAVDKFSLSDNPDLSTVYTFTPTSDFVVIRREEVTFGNLKNLSVEPAGSRRDDDADNQSSTILDDTDDYDSEFNTIYGILDISKFQADSKYVSVRDSQTNERLRIEGGIVIRDPSDTITSEGIVDSSPGLYLSDPTSSVSDIDTIRAFSSSSNPWTDDFAGTLSTDSQEVTAGNLIFDNGLKITGINEIGDSGTVDSSSFTHKVLVQVNGVDYYLCLST